MGGSTTKVVGIRNKKICNPLFVRATDPVASLFGAFGKYLYDNNIPLKDVEKVVLTGVGSAYIHQPLYGLPTATVDEFLANGLGAQYMTHLDKLVVISMGTGTSFVSVEGDKVKHIGGIGIGGGTILGLSRLLLKTQDFKQIIELAMKGNISNIDLQIQDICNKPLPGLPLEATASIFGKAAANASMEDVATGIVCMVLQSIGQAAILSALNTNVNDFVLIGNLTRMPLCKEVFPVFEKMFKKHFIIPGYAEYRTAIGAALSYIRGREFKEIG